ncbi:hypothetical protein AB7M49_003954 [Bradyrhizobium elkanii]|jgi:hypothetical protein|uniref:hypothetical protein n=1 Tax=Bradyrhizobium TaxID=374 RepID=UPI000481D696|nr:MULTISPECIES: hypothetical protein [Bradyrhizobium]MCP1929326.1 hypothetical protein [Bradyrhizobium elkanii]MCS3452373.1 hypothetical protein [Bradyrhizobium elkanii]MCS3473355.1 hypothetical protein [Bradyrhizobium elkanii]MCS3565524.1 hypothetical protein [Bradyrhizobium elkanii]MCS3580062.1 hypothetical protein [Bradyrhizobium elkanii]
MKEVPAPHIQYDEQATGQEEQFEKAFDILFVRGLEEATSSNINRFDSHREHWSTRGSMRHSNVGCGKFTARLIRWHCWHRRGMLKMSRASALISGLES